MITSVIGKLFLEAYNEKFGTHYDAKTFFIEIFYPLFFHRNKYMMTAGNSPLENPKISWEKMLQGKISYESSEQRQNRFEKLVKKIEGEEADASIARGYFCADVCATTSGQVSDMCIDISIDDIYASWIGDALGIGVQGGFCILFTQKNILLDIYKGWWLYRQMLDSESKLKGNQINTWNGQWLSHYYDSYNYDEEVPMAGFFPTKAETSELLSINTQTWTKILIGISRKYQEKKLLSYIYSIGQTNTTIGFIPFYLNEIRKPQQLYQKYFGIDNSRNAELLWGGGIGFKTACTQGVIGIKAMEPKGLKEYINNNKPPKAPKNEEEQININVYKIWILAMLNNEELWEKSLELAEMLKDASFDKDKSISTKRKNLVEQLLNATKKMQFIAMATEVIPFVNEKETFIEMVREINRMSDENVPYFLTLLRFQYKTI